MSYANATVETTQSIRECVRCRRAGGGLRRTRTAAGGCEGLAAARLRAPAA